jgi:formylmethanofuran dehydrogenase subunit C
VITLTLRAAPAESIEVDGVTPDRLSEMSEVEVSRRQVWVAGRQAFLGDVFRVDGGYSDRLRVEGDLARVHGLGAATAGGELTIAGSAGDRTGAGMTGGRIEVLGDAGNDAGVGMRGGILRIRGRAGDRLGAASPGASRGMTGGEIVVDGAAGADVAARARRGLIVIGGDTGRETARSIIAGTVVVLGRTGPDPGRGSKRGSIVALGGIDVPPTYIYACTFEPSYVRLLLTYLHRTYGLIVPPPAVDGLYARYCGDAGDPGKGEILELL